MQLLTNLTLQTTTFSHRAIQQGHALRVKVPGSENGLLVGAVYTADKQLVAVRYDGIPGNLKITPENPTGMDPKDGLIEIPLRYPSQTNLPIMTGYTLHIQAFSSPVSMIPQAWNIEFDIVP